MPLLRNFLLAACAMPCFASAFAVESAERQYSGLAVQASTDPASAPGRIVELDVDLAGSPGFSHEVANGRMAVRYRMAFNQIAEGWSWRPLADPAVDDYYAYKFLPLQSVISERAGYTHEDKIGVPQQVSVRWRYDYFLAFANLYDFYPRRADDEAGFSADLPAAVGGHVGIRAKVRLIAPVVSESTTFYKATYTQPTDFTLKKRYLVGELLEIDFVDSGSGEILCRIVPGQAHCTRP